MISRLILTLDRQLSVEERDTLRYLISDALAEFASHREPAKEYVDKRYPNVEGYAWLDRDKKVQQVYGRTKLARSLHNAALGVEVQDVAVVNSREEAR